MLSNSSCGPTCEVSGLRLDFRLLQSVREGPEGAKWHKYPEGAKSQKHKPKDSKNRHHGTLAESCSVYSIVMKAARTGGAGTTTKLCNRWVSASRTLAYHLGCLAQEMVQKKSKIVFQVLRKPS